MKSAEDVLKEIKGKDFVNFIKGHGLITAMEQFANQYIKSYRVYLSELRENISDPDELKMIDKMLDMHKPFKEPKDYAYVVVKKSQTPGPTSGEPIDIEWTFTPGEKLPTGQKSEALK